MFKYVMFVIAALPTYASEAMNAEVLSLSQMLLSLALVVALLFAMAWVIKRVQQPGLMTKNKQLHIVDSVSLGLKEKVVLLQVGKQKLLLGVTPGQLSKLSSFDEDDFVAVDNGSADKGLQDFGRKLQDIISRGNPS